MKLPLFHSLGLAALIGVAAVASHAETVTASEGRMTLADDRAHVFVFDLDADQPLLAVKSYDLDEGLPQF